jgi:hypothetical protein
MLLLLPSWLPPKFHPPMKLEGLGKSWSLTNRDGSADKGVSSVSRPFTCGGGGRANGFGGPLAPADSRADAERDGGGKTGPLRFSRIGVSMLLSRDSRWLVEGELVLVLSDSPSSAGI